MKKLSMLTAACTLAAAVLCSQVSAADAVNVTIDGKTLESDTPAQIVNGRTLVPLRAIFEALGAEVSWDGNEKSVSADKGSASIYMKIDADSFTVNGDTRTLDVPASIINGRTMVPARAVSESLGCNVNWDSAGKTVIITTGSGSTEVPGFDDRELISGSLNGYGELRFDDGSVYKGELKNGSREGEGSILYDNCEDENDIEFLSATWVNDEPDGYAEYYCLNGTEYRGEFKNGAAYGKGECYFPQTGLKIVSTFDEEGNANGYSELIFDSGETIKGEFKEGKPFGKCLYTDKDGKVSNVIGYDEEEGWITESIPQDMTVPDMADYSRDTLKYIESSSKNDYELIGFLGGEIGNEGWIKTYLSDLEEYNFRLIDDDYDETLFSGGGIKKITYYFEYTGNGDVESFNSNSEVSKSQRKGNGVDCDLMLIVSQHLGGSLYSDWNGHYTVYLKYAKELTYEGGDGSDYENTSSRSSSSDDIDVFDDDSDRGRSCSVCGGDGKRTCLTCGGDGELEETVSTPNYSGSLFGGRTKTIKKKCPNILCHNGEVDCTACGGDGVI